MEALIARPPTRLFQAALTVFLLVCVFAAVVDASHGHSLHERHHKWHSQAKPAANLLRRDAYACDANTPCSNGACCGAGGYCGYEPTYCGTGCVSNCDATAECGQYASTVNQTCPLNVCCSQYEFCGTTEDFCDSDCQSNCVLNTKPPAGAASLSVLENKVIGYYESWMARKKCHKVAPTDLPLDALTHLNFAFASIDPDSYTIVTMDSDTPSSLFKDATNVKSIKSDIKVFVSVGGWTFSDNGTATQPLYGEIAASATKRQTFADNVVHFLKQYGFDGLDIDWEYPGAGDRGGSAEDTANYVLLLQTLRKTFDASGNDFGLTFTAPSSYWYLRWFDLPSMVKYADWINLMTYDLHGVWDSTDPIGSIVQAHTNLTEIKQSAELFWRVDIPPEKLVMGFGFYGRSFTLADKSCTKPGCPFKGASSPGPCSDTGGILAYYEIQAILDGTSSSSKRSTITPIHDKNDAVNYFTFDDDQWVSYDDETTFAQKVTWANEVGLGGAMIWASDLDDDKYTAHAGLTNKPIMTNPTLKTIDKALSDPKSVIQDLASFNGQNCFKYEGKCVNLNDNNAMADACGSGYTVVGWDDAGCGKSNCHCGKPICCPTGSAPKNCNWRGDNTGDAGVSSDCNAQCKSGEINIAGIRSSWGGGFTNDGNTDKCGRGYKVFCCPDPEYKEVIDGCAYAGCGKDCPSGSTEMFNKIDTCGYKGQKYCCTSPADLSDCHWVGGSSGQDCANAKCASTELAVDRASYGDSSSLCDWSRQKVACCTVKKAAREPAKCAADLCTLFPGWCPSNSDETSVSYRKRGELNVLEKRGAREKYTLILAGVTIEVLAAAYPSIGDLFTIARAAQVQRWAFWKNKGYCNSRVLSVLSLPTGEVAKALYEGLNSEHVIDRQVIKKFIEAVISGTLTSGAQPDGLLPMSATWWATKWREANAALAGLPAVGSDNGAQPSSPNDRIMEAFGSTFNPYPLLATDAGINGAKGKLMGLKAPFSIKNIEKLAKAAVKADTDEAVQEVLTALQSVFGMFEYFADYRVSKTYNWVLQSVGLQMAQVEYATGVQDLQKWWWAWAPDYFQTVEDYSQGWAVEAIRAVAGAYAAARADGRNLKTNDAVAAVLSEFESKIQKMSMPKITATETTISDLDSLD
ncbi:CAZyme family GH18 [Penicillium roqueforti]|uniref:CAZyme family GH18 n=1 Tax=Penicillium roqueforti TaxID=5082 RepID=UPI0019096826|nr:CAZyme family GH18 [Penicillium roqueforti]KAF9249765.1 CAZyme family GH18 [Penicillium roqueforti]KAI1829853.1 CAZyme family GH18 [Penicillium roqueforti]KAI3121692.1 CAZyme family GH18 [Penicillium roqueforti]KAI3160875.1 CAZyme family GH18 [Penicillium roqueforti]